MGVAGQPVAAHLVAEVVELLLGQPPLDVGPGVDARRGVALEEDLVAEAAVGLAAEEVVEADLVERGRAGVGGEVPADALGARVGPRHHGGGVPADVGADPALLVLVAGEPRLGVGRDGVDVGRRHRGREVDLLGARPLEELHQQVARPGTAVGVDDGVERVEPLLRLPRVGVGNLMADAVEQHLPHGIGTNGNTWTTGRGCYTCGHASRRRPDHRVHRRRVPGQSRAAAGGPGRCPDGPYASGADPHTTNQRMEITAALEALRALEPDEAGGDRSGERLDLRRQVLHRRLVAGMAAAQLEELAEQAGGQPRPVGAAHRARAVAPTSTSASAGSRATRATAGTTGWTSSPPWRPIRGTARAADGRVPPRSGPVMRTVG